MATDRDETRRAIAKPRTAREAFVAGVAEHLKALVLAGDRDAARVAVKALATLLGLETA